MTLRNSPTAMKNLHDQRREYDNPPLDESSLPTDPFELFANWYQHASDMKLLEPNAMVLATVDPSGRPTQRTVLLKYFDRDGMVFFTNFKSRKASHIEANPNVSILFQWLPLHRQIEIDGIAERVSTAESLKYFALRPRGSQLGAWVSEQSSIVTSRSLLDAKLAELKEKFMNREVPWPSFWGGFRVVPRRFEFWQGQPNRLHDRFQFERSEGKSWSRNRLAP